MLDLTWQGIVDSGKELNLGTIREIKNLEKIISDIEADEYQQKTGAVLIAGNKAINNANNSIAGLNGLAKDVKKFLSGSKRWDKAKIVPALNITSERLSDAAISTHSMIFGYPVSSW